MEEFDRVLTALCANVTRLVQTHHMDREGRKKPFIAAYEDAIDQAVAKVYASMATTVTINTVVYHLNVNEVFVKAVAATAPVLARASGTSYTGMMVAVMTATPAQTHVLENMKQKVYNVVVCYIPIMVGSKYCISRTDPDYPRHYFGPPDEDGYFVVDGTNVTMTPVSHSRNSPGRCVVRVPGGSKDRVMAGYFPRSGNPTIMNIITDYRKQQLHIMIRVPGSPNLVPFGLACKALGLTRQKLVEACPLLAPYNLPHVWQSPSLDVLDDDSISSLDACDEIHDMYTSFASSAQIIRGNATPVDYISRLLFGALLTYGDTASSKWSVSARRQCAFLFLFQYLVLATQVPECRYLVNALHGPILLTFDWFSEQVVDVAMRARQSLISRAEGVATISELFKKQPDSAASNVLFSAISHQPQKGNNRTNNRAKRGKAPQNVAGVVQKTATHATRVANLWNIRIPQPNPDAEIGTVCSFYGPKTDRCEKSRHLAVGCFRSAPAPGIGALLQTLRLVPTIPTGTHATAILVDGMCVGYTRHSPEAVVEHVEAMRADILRGIREVTCVHIRKTNVVAIYAQEGRLCFYVFDLRRLRRMPPDIIEQVVNGIPDGRINECIDYFIRLRVLCVFDDACTAQTKICVGVTEETLRAEVFTHALPSDALAMSISTLIANPAYRHQTAVRTVHASTMVTEQAFGAQYNPLLASAGMLYYPQQPLSTRCEQVDTENGTYAQVLVIACSSVDEEAVMIKESFAQRGGATVDTFTTNVADRIIPTAEHETAFYAALKQHKERFPETYSHLDSDGIIAVGAPVKMGTILVFDFLAEKGPDGTERYSDKSTRYKTNQRGRVRSVILANGRISVTSVGRVIPMGMKVSIGPLKGVIGVVVPDADMPVAADGTSPDVMITIFNVSRGAPSLFPLGAVLDDMAMEPDAYSVRVSRDAVHHLRDPDTQLAIYNQRLAAGKTYKQKLCARICGQHADMLRCPDEYIIRYSDSCRVARPDEREVIYAQRLAEGMCTPHDPRNGGCTGRCTRIFCGATGLYMGRHNSATGVFEYSTAETFGVLLYVLAQVTTIKSKVTNSLHQNSNPDGTHTGGAKGMNRGGYMERMQSQQFADPYAASAASSSSVDVHICTMPNCDLICQRNQQLRLVCPAGHPPEYIQRRLIPAALLRITHLAAGCGISIKPAGVVLDASDN